MSYTPFAFARTALMNVLNATKLDQVDLVPDGFNNSIRWNAGHALVITDRVLHYSEHYSHILPPHYKLFFDMGTKPANWTDSPPTIDEIAEMSAKQIETAAQLFTDYDGHSKLTNVFDLRGTQFTTIPELLGFLAYHEGMHFNTSKLIFRKSRV